MGKKIFHLYIKDKEKHSYYGSLQALFNHFNNLGVSKFTLDRYDFANPFENEKIVIRKGEFLSTGDVKQKSQG